MQAIDDGGTAKHRAFGDSALKPIWVGIKVRGRKFSEIGDQGLADV